MEPKPEPTMPAPKTESAPQPAPMSSSAQQTPPPTIPNQSQPAPQTPPTVPPSPVTPKPKASPKRPMLAITLATIIFIGLVVAAYYAYAKSK